MSRERYVIVGLAKTGTTAIAMTLRNTLRIEGFCMEPQELAVIEAETHDRLVIKILFDHWLGRIRQLQDFFSNSSNGGAPFTIAIVRDPRDEAVSRLHYLAYNYFSTRPTTDDDRADWLEIFRRKEEAPNSVGLVDMENQLKRRFGAGFLVGRQVYEAFVQFIDELLGAVKEKAYLLRYEDFVGGTIPAGPLQSWLSGNRNVGPWFRRVHRHGSSGDWRGFLTDEDLAVVNSLCKPFLRRFSYSFEREVAKTEAAARNLSRKTGSDYVDNLITEARRDYLARANSVPT
jgi:hypothetical protein